MNKEQELRTLLESHWDTKEFLRDLAIKAMTHAGITPTIYDSPEITNIYDNEEVTHVEIIVEDLIYGGNLTITIPLTHFLEVYEKSE